MKGFRKGWTKVGIVVLTLSVFLVSVVGLALAQEATFERLWPKVQREGVLKIGVATCPPHCMKDPKTGEWSGVAINVMKELAKVLDVKLECIDTTWDYIIAGCQAKKWDIAVALNQTPRRALAVSYSEPFYFYEISLSYRKDNPKLKGASKNEDFDKKRLIGTAMTGSAQDKAMRRILKNAEMKGLPDTPEARMAVLSGRADYLADDAATNYLFYLANSDTIELYYPDPPVSREGISFGFRKTVSLDEIQVLDILIKELRNKGKLREWEKEFGTLIIKELK